MDPLKNINKFVSGERNKFVSSEKKQLKPTKKSEKKRFELKLKINLWKALIGLFLVIFFLPFILAIIQFQGEDQKVETSQALIDIKRGQGKRSFGSK